MLPAYYWLESPGESFLRFNYGAVAWVRADVAGFGVTINWRGEIHHRTRGVYRTGQAVYRTMDRESRRPMARHVADAPQFSPVFLVTIFYLSHQKDPYVAPA